MVVPPVGQDKGLNSFPVESKSGCGRCDLVAQTLRYSDEAKWKKQTIVG